VIQKDAVSWGRLSLGWQVLIAVVLGIACGLLFGPLCNIFKPIGDAYVMLLQMVALPYICLSIIHGLGSMGVGMGKKLFKSGWPFYIALWALIFILIYLASFAIPNPVSIFLADEPGLDESKRLSKNFLKYLVPENPFYDLTNNIVPAIAIFGLIAGCALMHLEKKEPVLSFLERSNQIIEKILLWLAYLSPIGVFSHISVAMGTVYFKDLYALEFYVVAFILICLFATLWILPALLSSLTPLTFKEALSSFRYVCILPFATAVPTIAFPFIIAYMKKLGKKHAEGASHFQAASQTVLPICYSFGQIGNCLMLFYIFFLSFYYRLPLGSVEKSLLSILTVPMSIGSSATSTSSIAFLIQQLGFPKASIDLFNQTMAVTLNFQVLLSIASVLTLIILVIYAYWGLLEIKWRRLFFHLTSATAVLCLCVGVGKRVLHLKDNFSNLYMDLKMSEVIQHPPRVTFLTPESMTPRSVEGRGESYPFDQILTTGVLKVAYSLVDIPYSYKNNYGEIVGYDIAYAYALAKDLDCALELYPIDLKHIGEDLDRGAFDIAMCAIIMSERRIKEMDFTVPYAEQNNVLVVPVKDRVRFLKLGPVFNSHDLRIGGIGGYYQVAEHHFPNAQIVQMEDYEPLLTGKIDAMVGTRISDFIWCLSHPEFTVIDYNGLIGKRYFAYPIQTGAIEWAAFLSNWLILKEQAGFKHQMHRYWIEAENPKERAPRWSVIRNVLHWVD
jgi:Na+/H+-dicarboxylate symporter